VERKEGVAQIDDLEMKKGFISTIQKLYTHEQATLIENSFLKFAILTSPTLNKAAKVDLLGMAQRSPNGWRRQIS
jgi:hypothetical protein